MAKKTIMIIGTDKESPLGMMGSGEESPLGIIAKSLMDAGYETSTFMQSQSEHYKNERPDMVFVNRAVPSIIPTFYYNLNIPVCRYSDLRTTPEPGTVNIYASWAPSNIDVVITVVDSPAQIAENLIGGATV
ncbi:MAG TPA: hypothetical protein VJI12_02255 [archaeon]|nr:hypothetical protein [archaeon]